MIDSIRILHLITGLDPGGAQSTLYRLVSRIDHQRFHNVVVVMTNVGSVGDKILATGIPVYSLRMRRGIPSLSAVYRLNHILKRERPHIIQTWLYHADLLGLLVAQLSRMKCVAWNVRCSNMDMRQYSRLSSWSVHLCAKLSWLPAVVVVNSEAGRLFHSTLGYRPRRWAVIPNGFDLEQFAPDAQIRMQVRNELGIPQQAILIGLVARLDPMKDHTTFFCAAGKLGRTDPSVQFLLVGEGIIPTTTMLSQLVSQEGLKGRVHLLGSRSDIPRLIAALDIASSSSSYGEGFPNVVGEAMACGVPCVVTDVGDSAKIVGETGIVVPPRSPELLAEGWRKLIEMGPEGRQRLGYAARERIRQNYSIESVVSQYENLYVSLIEYNGLGFLDR